MARKILHGRIKAGEGTLVGNSGEHHVMAELLRRSIIAAQTPRNSPAFDILATNGKLTAKIRVKTKSMQYAHWQWNIKKDGSIFRQISKDGDFVVMVNLKGEFERPDFYIVPTHQIDEWLRTEYEKWVRTPGKNGRPHDPRNKQRHLDHPKFEEVLNRDYRDRWQLMWR